MESPINSIERSFLGSGRIGAALFDVTEIFFTPIAPFIASER